MNYRVYLLQKEHIRAGESFSAFSDHEAVEVGSVLYDACSDVMDGCEVWCGPNRVATIPRISHHSRLTLLELTAIRQHHILELEERLSSSFACIRESRRLLDLLSHL
jgi:hypothetical protein